MPAIGRSSMRMRRLARIAAVELLRQRLEALDRLGLQPAIGQFLDAVGQPAFEEAPIVGRRLGLEEVAPLLLQLRRRRGLQRRQARQHGVGHRPFSGFSGLA